MHFIPYNVSIYKTIPSSIYIFPTSTYHENFHLNDARRNPFIQIQRLYEPSFKQNILYKPSEISFMHKNKMRRDVKIRRGLSFLQFFFSFRLFYNQIVILSEIYLSVKSPIQKKLFSCLSKTRYIFNRLRLYFPQLIWI